MKKLILLSVISAFILGLTAPCFAGNALKNSGFETGALDPQWGESGPPAEVTTEAVYRGQYSAAKIVDDVSEQDYWSSIFQRIPVIGGSPLYASVIAKTTFSPLALARAGLTVIFEDANNDEIPNTALISRQVGGTRNWVNTRISAKTIPADAKFAIIHLTLWAPQDENGNPSETGKVYFDNAYSDNLYREIPIGTALVNAGFENGVNDWLVPNYNGILGPPFYATDAAGNVRFGKYAVYNTIEKTYPREYYANTYQEVRCAAGQKVTGRVYAKTEFPGNTKGVAGITIEYRNANNKLLAVKTKSTKNTSWTKLQLPDYIAPAGTAKVVFILFVYNPATGSGSTINKRAYFDAAFLKIANP